jgi:ABC-2 type transport system ATP-binding protein
VSEPILEVRNLIKRYSTVTAVDGLSLAVPEGICFGLLGPNGAGKTTTIEIMEGILAATSGEVRYRGAPLDQRFREEAGILFQKTALQDFLTVRQSITLFRGLYARGLSVDEVIRMCALEKLAERDNRKLSGGQQQRLLLAIALVNDPSVLFLDEPTTGLDPQARLNVWEVIERFRREGGTVLVTTHYMEEAARLCDRVAIMDAGRIIAIDTPTHLIASLGAEQVLEVELTRAETDERFLADLPNVVSVRRRGRAFALATGSLGELLPRVLRACEERGNPITTLTTHAATLEDVFVALTGKALRDA